MTQEEISEIYHRLLELTRSGALEWRETGMDEYSVSFSRSTVTIERQLELGEPRVFMLIYNDNGAVVAKAFTGASPERSSVVREFVLDPAELLDLVRDRVDTETSTNLLEELRGLDVRQKERAAR